MSALSLQNLASSNLLVSPTSQWQELVEPLLAATHVADRWQTDPEKALSIAEVRQLQQFAARSAVSTHKLAIIWGADRLKAESANALLKLLEEPPAYLYIILCSETDQLLPTVRSRLTRLSIQANSDTLGGKPQTDLEVWQKAFSSFNLDIESERGKAQGLLYLQALAHTGIKTELLTQNFTS